LKSHFLIVGFAIVSLRDDIIYTTLKRQYLKSGFFGIIPWFNFVFLVCFLIYYSRRKKKRREKEEKKEKRREKEKRKKEEKRKKRKEKKKEKKKRKEKKKNI
jgi:flagellar biosynthesis component FlhA